MKKAFFLFILLIFMSGCITIPMPMSHTDILSACRYKVDVTDGVNLKEAKLLAQQEVILRGMADNYYLEDPSLLWEREDAWGIRFYPKHKTFAEIGLYPKVLVIIKKKGRGVVFRKEE